MPRPEKERLVNTPPLFNSFKPTGVWKSGLDVLKMTLDEYEAIRLADYEGLDHAEAAGLMNISRSTFTRLIEKARKKTAVFITKGCELQIEGGNIHFRGNIIRCADCSNIFKTGFEEIPTACPSCGSRNLIDIAGGYGHGRCCRGHGRHGRGRKNGGRHN